jgi:hypothetical protein
MADTRQKLGALTKAAISFEAMCDLPDFESKRRALMRKNDEVFAVAKAGRSYVDKKGELHSQPDAAAMSKCVELGARLLGVLAEIDKRAKDDPGGTALEDLEEVAKLMRLAGYVVQKAA